MAMKDPFKLRMKSYTKTHKSGGVDGSYKAPRMSPKGKDPAPKQQEKHGLKN